MASMADNARSLASPVQRSTSWHTNSFRTIGNQGDCRAQSCCVLLVRSHFYDVRLFVAEPVKSAPWSYCYWVHGHRGVSPCPRTASHRRPHSGVRGIPVRPAEWRTSPGSAPRRLWWCPLFSVTICLIPLSFRRPPYLGCPLSGLVPASRTLQD